MIFGFGLKKVFLCDINVRNVFFFLWNPHLRCVMCFELVVNEFEKNVVFGLENRKVFSKSLPNKAL